MCQDTASLVDDAHAIAGKCLADSSEGGTAYKYLHTASGWLAALGVPVTEPDKPPDVVTYPMKQELYLSD